MKFDKLIKLNELLDEAKTVAEDLSLSMGKPLYRKIMKLLIMLMKMHALITSIRSECIEDLLSLNPDFPDDIKFENNLSQDKIVAFDRRRSKTERRKLSTYLSKDKRSGLADRRKRIKRIGSEKNQLPFSTIFPKRKSWI
jgi:hypothetical protein